MSLEKSPSAPMLASWVQNRWDPPKALPATWIYRAACPVGTGSVANRWATRPFDIIWFMPDLFLLRRLCVDGLVFRPHQLLSVGLLDRLFHANSIQDQLKLLENLGRVARDKGSHGVIGEQLSKVALGNDEIQQL